MELREKIKRLTGVGVAIAFGSTLLVGAATSAQAATTGEEVGVQHWSCGRAAPTDIDPSNRHWVKREFSPASMRIGSSTRCATNGGTARYLEPLDYHCWALDINGVDTWTYVQNVDRPNERGWINDKHLNDGGSEFSKRCIGDAAFVG